MEVALAELKGKQRAFVVTGGWVPTGVLMRAGAHPQQEQQVTPRERASMLGGRQQLQRVQRQQDALPHGSLNLSAAPLPARLLPPQTSPCTTWATPIR